MYGILCITLLCIYKYSLQSSSHIFSSKKGTLNIISQGQKNIIIDQQFLVQQHNYKNWIQYTLIPLLSKKSGTVNIETLIMSKLSSRSIEIIEFLNEQCPISHIIVPHHVLFSLLVDKLSHHCVILTSIKEQKVLFSYNDYSIHLWYDKKKKSLKI